MRRLGVVLGVAAVMAAIVALTAGTALAQAITDRSRTVEPFAEIIVNPCTGEEILFEGTFRQVTHFVQTDAGDTPGDRFGVHGGIVGVVTATGTGLETGEKYRLVQQSSSANHMEIELGENGEQFAGLFIDQFGSKFLVVSNGASPNFVARGMFHTTNDIDGQPNTSFEMAAVGCTPEVETTNTHS